MVLDISGCEESLCAYVCMSSLSPEFWLQYAKMNGGEGLFLNMIL